MVVTITAIVLCKLNFGNSLTTRGLYSHYQSSNIDNATVSRVAKYCIITSTLTLLIRSVDYKRFDMFRVL